MSNLNIHVYRKRGSKLKRNKSCKAASSQLELLEQPDEMLVRRLYVIYAVNARSNRVGHVEVSTATRRRRWWLEARRISELFLVACLVQLFLWANVKRLKWRRACKIEPGGDNAEICCASSGSGRDFLFKIRLFAVEVLRCFWRYKSSAICPRTARDNLSWYREVVATNLLVVSSGYVGFHQLQPLHVHSRRLQVLSDSNFILLNFEPPLVRAQTERSGENEGTCHRGP